MALRVLSAVAFKRWHTSSLQRLKLAFQGIAFLAYTTVAATQPLYLPAPAAQPCHFSRHHHQLHGRRWWRPY